MRYFLDDDPDGHWFLIPEDRRAEWDAWCRVAEGNGDDDDDFDPAGPAFARPLGGHPCWVLFEKPEDLNA